jgi:hypothetical protein
MAENQNDETRAAGNQNDNCLNADAADDADYADCSSRQPVANPNQPN